MDEAISAAEMSFNKGGDNFSNLLRLKRRSGELTDERLRIIECLMTPEQRNLENLKPALPITNRESSEIWFRDFLERAQSDSEVLSRTLIALAKDMPSCVGQIDQDYLRVGNRYNPVDDPERMKSAQAAFHFLEDHLNGELSPNEQVVLRGHSITMRAVANSYPGREPGYGRRTSRNPAAEVLQTALEILLGIKTGQQFPQLRFQDLWDAYIEVYVRIDLDERRRLRQELVASPEAYQKIQKVLSAQMMSWVLGARDPVRGDIQNRMVSDPEIREESKESIQSSQTGFRAFLQSLLRKIDRTP